MGLLLLNLVEWLCLWTWCCRYLNFQPFVNLRESEVHIFAQSLGK